MFDSYHILFTKFLIDNRVILEDFLRGKNINEIILFELLSNETGRKLWIEKGHGWKGFFDLAVNSKSNDILYYWQINN